MLLPINGKVVTFPAFDHLLLPINGKPSLTMSSNSEDFFFFNFFKRLI